MATLRGRKQASFRAIHEAGAGKTYTGDMLAAVEAETGSASGTQAGALIRWLQLRTGRTSSNLSGLAVAFARDQAVRRWDDVGSFPPFIVADMRATKHVNAQAFKAHALATSSFLQAEKFANTQSFGHALFGDSGFAPQLFQNAQSFKAASIPATLPATKWANAQSFKASIMSSPADEPPEILGTPLFYEPGDAGATTHNIAYTLGAGADLVAIVYIDNATTFVGATWTATGAAGQAVPTVVADANGNTKCRILALKNPNVGTAAGVGVLSVQISASNLVGVLIYSIGGWSGVAPAVASQDGAAVTDPDPLAIDPAPNSLIIHGVCGANAGVTMTFGTAADEAEDLDSDEVGSSNNQWQCGAAHKSVTSGDATTVNVVFASSPLRYAEVVAAFPA